MIWSPCCGWLYSIALRDEVHSSDAAHCSPEGEYTSNALRRLVRMSPVTLHDAVHTLITVPWAETKVQANVTGQVPIMAVAADASNQSHLQRAPRCCCQPLRLIRPRESHHTAEPVRLVYAQRAARMCTPCLALRLCEMVHRPGTATQ